MNKQRCKGDGDWRTRAGSGSRPVLTAESPLWCSPWGAIREQIEQTSAARASRSRRSAWDHRNSGEALGYAPDTAFI
jgi:hypothetical protein